MMCSFMSLFKPTKTDYHVTLQNIMSNPSLQYISVNFNGKLILVNYAAGDQNKLGGLGCR